MPCVMPDEPKPVVKAPVYLLYNGATKFTAPQLESLLERLSKDDPDWSYRGKQLGNGLYVVAVYDEDCYFLGYL